MGATEFNSRRTRVNAVRRSTKSREQRERRVIAHCCSAAFSKWHLIRLNAAARVKHA